MNTKRKIAVGFVSRGETIALAPDEILAQLSPETLALMRQCLDWQAVAPAAVIGSELVGMDNPTKLDYLYFGGGND